MLQARELCRLQERRGALLQVLHKNELLIRRSNPLIASGWSPYDLTFYDFDHTSGQMTFYNFSGKTTVHSITLGKDSFPVDFVSDRTFLVLSAATASVFTLDGDLVVSFLLPVTGCIPVSLFMTNDRLYITFQVTHVQQQFVSISFALETDLDLRVHPGFSADYLIDGGRFYFDRQSGILDVLGRPLLSIEHMDGLANFSVLHLSQDEENLFILCLADRELSLWHSKKNAINLERVRRLYLPDVPAAHSITGQLLVIMDLKRLILVGLSTMSVQTSMEHNLTLQPGRVGVRLSKTGDSVVCIQNERSIKFFRITL